MGNRFVLWCNRRSYCEKKIKNYNDVTRCYNIDITTLPLGEYYHAKINKILGPNEMGLSKSIACNWEYYTQNTSHIHSFFLWGGATGILLSTKE